MAALPQLGWNAIGVFEIACALGLILPGILKLGPEVTGYFAVALALELLLISGLHLKFFGFAFGATNPATWSLARCALSIFVAFGRLR